MLAFKRVFFVLFLTFASIFLFIFLIRLANNKTGFLGMNDLLTYFEGIDLYKPLERFKDTFDDLKKCVDEFLKSINITNIFGGSGSGGGRGSSDTNFWNGIANAIGSVFSWLGTNIVNFFKMLYTIIAMPIKLVFDLVGLIVDYFGIFIKFVNYMINFEGYSSSTLIIT